MDDLSEIVKSLVERDITKTKELTRVDWHSRPAPN